MKWISVKDRLPDISDDYLIVDRSCVHMAYWDGWRFTDHEGDWYFEVTHWQPLPEPPAP